MRPLILCLLLVSCVTSPVRRCDHPFQHGLWLTARSADDVASLAPPPTPPWPVAPAHGWGLAPARVVVTVHNEDDLPVAVALRCGAAGAERPLEVVLGPFQERDLSFTIPRSVDVSTHFSCEITDFRR